MITEALELNLEGILDGTPDDGLPHVDGQGFDRIEIQVEPRPFLAIGAAGDDSTPPVRHVAKVGRIDCRTDSW